MTESRTGPVRPNGWSGLAGLLVALFVVAGLVAGYGLGHAPPMRICTEHAVSTPLAAAAATPGGSTASAAAAPDVPSGSASGVGSGGLGGLAGAVHADVVPLPLDLPGPPAGDVCLCLAVLLTLMAVGLSGGARRPFLRLPARVGRTAAPPTVAAFTAPSLSALQVLRL